MVADMQNSFASQISGRVRSKAKERIQEEMEMEEMSPGEDEFLVKI